MGCLFNSLLKYKRENFNLSMFALIVYVHPYCNSCRNASAISCMSP